MLRNASGFGARQVAECCWVITHHNNCYELVTRTLNLLKYTKPVNKLYENTTFN